MAMMFALCLTVTAVWTHLGPPGSAAADEKDVVTASVDEAADMAERQVLVTEMDMAGSGNTIEVMQMAMTNTPETVNEAAEDTVTRVTVRDMTEEGIPANEETENEDQSSEGGGELPDEQDAEDTDTEDTSQGAEDAEGYEPEETADEADSGETGGNTDDGQGEETDTAGDEETAEAEEDIESEEQVMLAVAKVDGMLNVRAEASEDAEIVGMLYKDSGGKILEQTDGWTQMGSGARTVSSLNVRTDSNMDAQIIGSVHNGDRVEIVNVQENGWAEVTYNDSTAYINTNYADVGISLQTGDTIDAYIEKVAEQKKAKVAQAEENAAEAGLEVTVTEEYVPQDASDLEMLATIIYCEAGNQSHEGKVAVGNVVLNRVGSDKFPNDIDSVLRADRQFSPVGSGKYDRMLGSGRIPQSCYDAAQEAMDGISYAGGCLYFKNPNIAGAHSGITIGDHVFW